MNWHQIVQPYEDNRHVRLTPADQPDLDLGCFFLCVAILSYTEYFVYKEGFVSQKVALLDPPILQDQGLD